MKDRRPISGSFEEIVSSYIREYRAAERAELDFYRDQPTLQDAVHVAALAVRRNGNRHPYQSRRSLHTLETARDALLRADVQACQSFDDLHEVVKHAIAEIS